MTSIKLKDKIFRVNSDQEFNDLCLELFRYQYKNNSIYQLYLNSIRCNIESVSHYSMIPYLPIEFFKSHVVSCVDPLKCDIRFESSGTMGSERSSHYVAELELYQKSFISGFERFYGSPEKYIIIALLPSYLERQNSSLVYMADQLIKLSKHSGSGFYLEDNNQMIKVLESADRTVLLLGVTFALLDMKKDISVSNKDLIIMETGGMKGRRKEMIRQEIHQLLTEHFGQESIHSEYGMTELLSQAYSDGRGIFKTPPWMKVLVRDTNDPLSLLGDNKTGGLNIIDLANLHSCSFIATQDLGRRHPDGSFEVLGRFDYSDIRGCNLMVG